MKKLLSLVLIGTLVLSLTACGNSGSKDNSSSKETTTTKKEEKKEPLNLTGTWKSDENEGTWMEATISDNVISIDWVTYHMMIVTQKLKSIRKDDNNETIGFN